MSAAPDLGTGRGSLPPAAGPAHFSPCFCYLRRAARSLARSRQTALRDFAGPDGAAPTGRAVDQTDVLARKLRGVVAETKGARRRAASRHICLACAIRTDDGGLCPRMFAPCRPAAPLSPFAADLMTSDGDPTLEMILEIRPIDCCCVFGFGAS
jgi:hypothetical protein